MPRWNFDLEIVQRIDKDNTTIITLRDVTRPHRIWTSVASADGWDYLVDPTGIITNMMVPANDEAEHVTHWIVNNV